MERAANRMESRRTNRAGFLGLAGAVLILGVSRLGSAALEGDEPPAAAVCGAWHRGGAEGQPFDLERTRRGYRELRDRLSQSLRRSIESELGALQAKGYDSALPACGRSGERRFRPSREIPSDLRGKSFWLFSIEGRKHPVIPEQVRLDPNVVALATRVDRLESLTEVSKVLGRPVGLMPPGFAEALGVRCAPTFLSIRADGEVAIHENP